MKNKLENHGGKFISLSFKDGGKIKKSCCKIMSVTDKTVVFKDRNSQQVYKKMITSLV